MKDGLGREFFVHKHNEIVMGTRLGLDGRHKVFKTKAEQRRTTVVVTSYSQIQTLSRNDQDARFREGLFARIILDEGHSIRRFDGFVLKSYKAPFKCIYTASPVVNTLHR